ncbi:hypothetical protein GJV03_17710 [Acinetobacter sp. RIT698]|uniref:hypothetical protein n=1 Tax=Acinetobacter sp. RIT698 TaxID=2666192 RepID=UPI0012ACAF11|nr:hypothetical protein [Acinetobacter sp. RIT698]MRT38997.1 hypothetical protein [Acinetobacter sp. RIT698]
MSILENLLSIIFALFIGYLVSKTGWKLRYLAPFCFVVVFIVTWSVVSNFFSPRKDVIQFFMNGKFFPNSYTFDLLFASTGLACVSTFLLVLSVWAIRKNVFF